MTSAGEGSCTARILIIDHHDSYTLNLLISLYAATQSSSAQLLARTVVLPHNHALLATADSFKRNLLPHFDAVILGPGPGHPDEKRDFGAGQAILASILDGECRIPVLGICLGHQGIAVACGGKVVQADSLRHGLHSRIDMLDLSTSELALPGLFECFPGSLGTGPIEMIRYNSLTVEESTLPSDLVVTAWSHDPSCPAPTPRKTAYSPDQASTTALTSTPSSLRVVMALQHRSLPLWGVQFHPESISSQGGEQIFAQFLRNCRTFWKQQLSSATDDGVRQDARKRLLAWDRSAALPVWVERLGSPLVACSSPKPVQPLQRKRFRVVTHALKGSLPSYSQSSALFDRLFRRGQGSGSAVWLDSSRSGDPQSCFSYMSTPSWSISYEVDTKSVSLCVGDVKKPLQMAAGASSARVDLFHGLATPKASRASSPDEEERQDDFWTWLSTVQLGFQSATICGGESPFQAGFVGYLDYEMKRESLTRGKLEGCPSPSQGNNAQSGLPSAYFGFCDRLLAYDHRKEAWNAVYLISTDAQAESGTIMSQIESALTSEGVSLGLSVDEALRWVQEVENGMVEVTGSAVDPKVRWPTLPALTPSDPAQTYQAKVEAAREYISKGESYELCLTNRFTGTLPEGSGPDYSFDLYQGLRRKNPAPYSAFIDLGRDKTILSTSPERFMSIQAGGQVEMRPIKGTLARAGFREGEEDCRRGKERGEEAMVRWCEEEDERRRKTLECDPKERAENLMIVDLIRADLLSFCAPDSVRVPSLMKVESYESVHQLVTTIQGHKSESVGSLDALKRTFPPGSMTGAPKVRSVEILDKLEGTPRGVYSGILGWLGLDGAASFSVVIRTVVINGRSVSVGAGGAITYLSDAEREWQEVVDKVSSIAQLQGS